MSIRDQIVAARARLIAARIAPPEAARDAALLARHALGWDAASLLTGELDVEPPGFVDAFAALIQRRVTREPVAYIRGTQEFWGRPFAVCPGVLIPRPETELIVDEVLERAARGTPLDVIGDIGTGSGCLAVTLAAELPGTRIVATDVSSSALDVARANAERHGVRDRIDFVHGPYLAGATGPFDALVSNPPYIAERAFGMLPPEVRNFEPSEALVAGPDGLRDIRELVRTAPAALRPRALLIFEMGHDQSARASAIVANTPGLRLLHVRPDLQGHARLVIAHRRAER